MIDQGIRCDRKNPQFAYFAPNYGQARRVAWDYLKQYTQDIPGMEANEADLRVEIPRPHLGDKIRFMLLGAENPGSIRGIYLDGAILDEYAEMYPMVWTQVIRPALSDRLGWAIFIGTPKGLNHFHDVYTFAKNEPSWFSIIKKSSETGIIDPAELAAAKNEMSEEEFAQEFECSFSAALVGAYFGKQMETAESEGRIGDHPYDPAIPVDTHWDLGIDDATGIVFTQRLGNKYQIIDYLQESDRSLPEWAKALHEKPYAYGLHNVPHDAKNREFGTGKSRSAVLREHGIRIYQHNKYGKEDQINAGRMMLPKCYIDRTKCKLLIDALKNYQRKWDEKNKVFSQKPLHNWASHAADAWMLFSMGQREEHRENKRLQEYAINEYDPFAH
jgi:hypothetical protein